MSSTYCIRVDVEDVFGVGNVAAWADLDRDEDATKIAARIARAIASAGSEIDDWCRGTRYTLPLATAAGTTPDSVNLRAAELAGVRLYESRGVVDFNEQKGPFHRLIYYRRNVERWLLAVRSAEIILDAT